MRLSEAKARNGFEVIPQEPFIQALAQSMVFLSLRVYRKDAYLPHSLIFNFFVIKPVSIVSNELCKGLQLLLVVM